MVRFARAKGSKASNERLPEEATSWQELKEQMIDAQQRKVGENIFDVRVNIEDNRKVESTWATFENSKPNNHLNAKRSLSHGGKDNETVQQPQSKKKKKKQELQQGDTVHENSLTSTCVAPSKVKKKKDSTSWIPGNVESNEPKKENSIKHEDKGIPLCHSGTRKKLEKDSPPLGLGGTVPEIPQEENLINKDNDITPQSKIPKNIPHKSTKSTFVPVRATKKRGGSQFEKESGKTSGSAHFQMRGVEFPKTKSKPNDNSTINIGGKEVEIRLFDGFPIKKDDWVRLKELQEKMQKEKIPEDQIKAAMKLERRRAEKALARDRKKVCFHCRRPGHVLSECPSLEESPLQKGKDIIPDTANSGICFKCGSTEHTHLQCRVVKRNEFRFAKCFVCGEQGHISKQCPDNPRGMYPKGGACKICGDVTHLKKDCSQFQEQQLDAALTLSTLKDGGALEALDTDTHKSIDRRPKTSHKKVVKF